VSAATSKTWVTLATLTSCRWSTPVDGTGLERHLDGLDLTVA
jgi:hypothetical protein